MGYQKLSCIKCKLTLLKKRMNCFRIYKKLIYIMSKQSGTVKFFNQSKRYGFIKPDLGNKDIFVHATSLSKFEDLQEGQRVVFEIEESSRGIQAINIELE